MEYDTAPLLRDIEAADKRIDKLSAELQKAMSEKADLETTLRVLSKYGSGGVSGTAESSPVISSRPANEKKKLMLGILGVGREGGVQPSDVYKELVSSGVEDITIQVVRTTLWRAADKGEIASENGRYWKMEAEAPLFSEASAHNSSAGTTSGGTKLNDRPTDHEASLDAPFSRNGEVVHEVE